MIQYDITKCTMDDVYNQHIHAQLLTIHITFATRSCFAIVLTTIKYPHISHVLNKEILKQWFHMLKNSCH
jgi:hypothetical protein